MKTAANILTEEHKVILKVVGACGALAEKLENGEDISAEILICIVEFAQEYVDRFHHKKEEDFLFPALEQARNQSLIYRLKALKYEHEYGRKLISQLEQSINNYIGGKPGGRKTVMNALLSIPRLYPGHIYREDTIIFPMIKKVLDKDQQSVLVCKFEEIKKQFGGESHQRHIKYAARIEKEAYFDATSYEIDNQNA